MQAQTYPTQTPVYIPNGRLAAQTFTATGTYKYTNNGMGTVTLIVSGTFVATVAATGNLLSSAAGNAVTLNMTPCNGGAAVTSVSAPGCWQVATGGFDIINFVETWSSGTSITLQASGTTGNNPVAAQGGTQNVQQPATIGDPCQNSAVAKSSVALNVAGTASTTQLIALSSGKKIYVCGFSATVSGTTPTIQFLGGTGSACGTLVSTFTGAYGITTGSFIAVGPGPSLFTSVVSNELCLAAGGTAPYVLGVLEYVQQ